MSAKNTTKKATKKSIATVTKLQTKELNVVLGGGGGDVVYETNGGINTSRSNVKTA